MYFSTFALIGFFQVPFGFLLDRYPPKIMMMILLGFLMVSQVIIAGLFQSLAPNYKIGIYIMRSIFGFAG